MSNTIPFKQYPKSCSIKIDQNTTIGENVVISEKCKSISIGLDHLLEEIFILIQKYYLLELFYCSSWCSNTGQRGIYWP